MAKFSPNDPEKEKINYELRKLGKLSKLSTGVSHVHVVKEIDSPGHPHGTTTGTVVVPNDGESGVGIIDPRKVREGLLCTFDINNLANAYVHVVTEVNLPSHTYGIAKKENGRVAVTLSDHGRVDIIGYIGSSETLCGLPSRRYFDIAMHRNGNLVISHDSRSEIDIHSADGTKLSSIPIQWSNYRFRLSVGPSNEIIVANGSKRVFIYDPFGRYKKCTVPTEKNLSRPGIRYQIGRGRVEFLRSWPAQRVDGVRQRWTSGKLPDG